MSCLKTRRSKHEGPVVHGFKLFRLRRDLSLGPLFINKRQVVPYDVWLPAEDHPTKGFAHRPGWHAAPKPHAPHLKVSCERVWCEVRLKGVRPFRRPEIQGGEWYLTQEMLVVRMLPENEVRMINGKL